MKTRTYFITAILALLLQSVSAQIERIEPPFWWSGIQHAQLELMVYGEKIAELQPKIVGIKILEVKRTENPNYLFITLDTQNEEPQEFKIVFEKNGKRKFVESYELKERRPESAQRNGFYSSDMIYLVVPDRFADGDPSNDSHKGVVE